jgi:hypothetical protein
VERSCAAPETPQLAGQPVALQSLRQAERSPKLPEALRLEEPVPREAASPDVPAAH